MKVAICIPCHGDPKADFTFSLARLIAHTLRADPSIEIETLIARSSILVQSRTNLFNWAREWGADRILWLDSDHSFPPLALLRLLSHNRPVIGANYRRRTPEVYPAAVSKDAQGRWSLVQTNSMKAAGNAIERVSRIGFGFLLMEVRAIEAALGPAIYPLFETQSLPDGTFIGEDALLCDRLVAAGLDIWIDHVVSMNIGHITEQTLFFPEA